MKEGDRVTWTTVNGSCEGVVERVEQDRIVVRLESGKAVVGHENAYRKI